MKRLRQVFRKVRRGLTGPYPKTERTLGDERRSVGDWTMAARHYRAHVAKVPQDFDIWVQLGHAYKETGRLDDADAAYVAADKLKPDNSDLFLCRGHLAKQKGDLGAAAELYGRSFAIDANPAAARELGQISAREDAPFKPRSIRVAGAVEGFADGILAGWVIDPDRPDVPAEVEVLIDGVVVATGVGDIDRPDLAGAGLTPRAGGFLIDLSGRLDLTEPTELHARVAGSHVPLAGSPWLAEVTEAHRRWSTRWKGFSSRALRERAEAETPEATLSVIVFVPADGGRLGDLITSLEDQWSDRWEATLIPLEGETLILAKALEKRIARNGRVRVARADGPGSGPAVLRAVDTASGGPVMLLPSDSVLEPEAVWRVLDAAAKGADLVYWDEARIGRSVEGVERFVVRSALSIEHFRAFPGLIGSFAVDRGILAAVLNGKRSESLEELRLACVSRARCAAHVPAVLERRRGDFPEERQAAAPRSGPKRDARDQGGPERTLVVVSPDLELRELRQTVQAVLASTRRDEVDLLVLARGEPSAAAARYLERLAEVGTVWACDDAGPASQAINDAVAAQGAAHANLVLLEGPVSPSGAWLPPLLSHLSRPEVAIVAPILVSHDGRVVSAGLGVSAERLVPSHHGVRLTTSRGRSLGWNRSLVCLREQSAAHGCLALRTETFLGAGGLDPIMSSRTVLADLSLRLAATGRRTLIDPRAPVRIARAADLELDPAFRARWARRIADGDPFMSPSLDAALKVATLETTFLPARLRPLDPPLLALSTARWGMLSGQSLSERAPS